MREGHIVELQGRDRLYRLLPMGQLKRTIIDIMEETKEALGSNYGKSLFTYAEPSTQHLFLFQQEVSHPTILHSECVNMTFSKLFQMRGYTAVLGRWWMKARFT